MKVKIKNERNDFLRLNYQDFKKCLPEWIIHSRDKNKDNQFWKLPLRTGYYLICGSTNQVSFVQCLKGNQAYFQSLLVNYTLHINDNLEENIYLSQQQFVPLSLICSNNHRLKMSSYTANKYHTVLETSNLLLLCNQRYVQ